MENVKDLVMYHIHRCNTYDNMWKENSTLKIDDNFISYMQSNFKFFTTGLETSKGIIDFSNLLTNIIDSDFINSIDRDSLVSLLMESRTIISNATLINREMALENFRRKYYPNLPSRYHSVWLADMNSFNYWRETLDKDSIPFEVMVNGCLFKSNEELLPKSYLTYGEMYDSSEKYWNPNLDDVPRLKDEYLIKGNIRVLKKM